MAGLQRSAVSFRRQGSSGLVWEDRFLQQAEAARMNQRDEPEQDNLEFEDGRPPRINILDRNRSNGGGRAFRTGKVSPAIEPPSPKVSACGFCAGFGKSEKSQRTKPGKRRSR